MNADIRSRWAAASRLVNFFTHPPSPALYQEYSDLFWGTNADICIPLWASICEKKVGSLLDETTLAIVREYHRWGYVPIEMDGNPPDYIGQLLRFLCYLFSCSHHGDTYAQAADRFIKLHLFPTAQKVSEGIRRHSSTPEFLAVADALAGFCRGEVPPAGDVDLVTFPDAPYPAVPDTPRRTIITAGRNNCGGKCSILATEEEGCLLKVEANCSIGEPSFRPCVRGTTYRSTYLSGERLRYPMKRVGQRGEGRFVRISWEEAAQLITDEWIRIRDRYGPGSRYVNYGDGVSAVIRPDDMAMRLLNLDGGFLGRYGSYSSACAGYVTPYIYGDSLSGNSTEDLLNTRLLILWGHNPTETIFSPQLSYTITLAKERGTKVIVIDPRQSDSAVALGDEWIPIRPSTDGALAAAMAYVIWEEGLQDQAFMDKYCLGFDEGHMPEGVPAGQNYQNYIFGGLDGTPKTPEWAEGITGVPADTIRSLARQYAAAKPACLLPGLGYQRTGNGEQTVRAIAALTCMTGNVGIPGGGAAGAGQVAEEATPSFPKGERAYPGVISCFLWTKAIEDGVNMTRQWDHIRGVEQLDSNIKMLFNLASNTLINQHSDINRTAALLRDESKCEFILCSDVFMTPSARYADVLLPAPSLLEEDNITAPWRSGHYLLCNNRVVPPLFGCRNEYDWLSDVAKRLGLWEQWSEGRTCHTQWLEHIYSELCKENTDLPPYDQFMAQGGHTYQNPKTYIAYADQISEPETHPFATPSGKIEIVSPCLYDWHDPAEIPAYPAYVPCPEGPEDPLADQYPLQLIGWHTKRRTHSIHDNNPRMEEVDPQRMWIHPDDAAPRGLVTGSVAEVYNDRGLLRIPVLVTQRVMPGVVAIAQGGWYTPDSEGIDKRGSINVLTSHTPTPLARGNPQHTNLVEVRPAK